MTKTLLVVNRSLHGAGKGPRGTRWELSIDQYRGHPMVSRRGGSTVDYFRRCMARYYGWKVGGNPRSYSDFGYLADSETLALAAQSSTDYNIAFNIENAQTLESNVFPANDENPIDTIDYINSGEGANAMGSLFGHPTFASTTWGPSNPFSTSGLGTEHFRLQLEADDIAWQTVSNTKAITNFAKAITSESPNTDTDPWWNWQAYTLGDGALDFDGSARKFPGIFGPGMQGMPFFDHAFERTLPGVVGASTTYNYSNSFFDNIGSNPSVNELLVPNLYVLGSVMDNRVGDIAYPSLFQSHHQQWDPQQPSSQRNQVKSILGLTLGPTVGGTTANPAPDISAPGVVIPPGQIAAHSQTPNSLLSRFARRDFSDQDPAAIEEISQAGNINRHIGIPRRMLSGEADSIVKSMNAGANKFPYAIRVSLPLIEDNDSLADSMVPSDVGDATGDTMPEVTSNFFLYEVMKANILNFSNSPRSTTSTPSADLDYYEDLNLSAVLTEDTEKKYYGFSSTSTSPPWAQGPEALQPYSLRAIDLRNLFVRLFRYSMAQDPNESDTIYADPAEGPDGYTGFTGQTSYKKVAMGKGIIVGTRATHAVTPNVPASLPALINYEREANGLLGNDFADFFIQMSDFMNENTRNFVDMVSGETATRTTLVYKLDKHAVTSAGDTSLEPIQSIYFAAVEGLHEYTDTQVLFGKKYVYKLYAYDLVLGNQYQYSSAQVFPPIEDYYPNPLTMQLHGLTMTTAGSSPDWNLTSQGMYLGTGIGHQEYYPAISTVPEAQPEPESNPILYWQSGRIMPGIDLTDGVTLSEAIGALAFPSYVDIKIDGKYYEAPLPYLSAFLKPGGFWAVHESEYVQGLEDAINDMIDVHFDESTVAGATQMYLSKVRVRSVLNQSGNAQIFIAQVKTLVATGVGSPGQQAIVDSIRAAQGSGNPGSLNEEHIIFPSSDDVFYLGDTVGESTRTPYENYFDVSHLSTTLASLELSLLFHTGQHGIEPQIPWNLSDAGSATAIVRNYKSPKIIEIPIGQTNPIVVTDLPPQFPDVDIFPLKGSNREIKILLNSNFTKAAYAPIIIEPTDVGLFADVLEAQGKQVGEPVLFRSDDTAAAYQVFRTSDKPNSYQDFAGKLHLTKEATTPNNRAVEATSFLDTVDSNIYYYYCFRAIDKNGYVSNPTPVLRVQMVDDNGRVYPIIQPHIFDLSDPRKTEKSFKRYIEIDTSLQESMISDSLAGSAGDPYTAPTGISVGSSNGVYDSQTTYKVRVISKDTGRKIDLNLNFNIETIPNPKLPGN